MSSSRLEQLTKLHEADPTDPFCAYGIALEHVKAQQHDEAIRWFDKTIEADPAYCYAYYHKAKLLIDIGQDESARAVLRVGLETATQAGDDHAHSEITELLESLG